MGINAINSAMSASTYALRQNRLPDWIIEKLEQLGIDPEGVSSVSQAKQLIKQAEEANSKKSSSEDNLSKQNNGDSSELREKAVNLAEKVGVSVSETDTIDDISEKIKTVLEEAMKLAAKNGDEGLLTRLQAFRRELDDIEAEAHGGGMSENIVYSYFDMMAAQNKYALKLNNK